MCFSDNHRVLKIHGGTNLSPPCEISPTKKSCEIGLSGHPFNFFPFLLSCYSFHSRHEKKSFTYLSIMK